MEPMTPDAMPAPDATPAPPMPLSASVPAASPAPEPAPSPPVPAAGQLVAHTYFDPYSDAGFGGAEITVHGIVVEVTDTGARVAWLLDASDPVPLDELTIV